MGDLSAKRCKQADLSGLKRISKVKKLEFLFGMDEQLHQKGNRLAFNSKAGLEHSVLFRYKGNLSFISSKIISKPCTINVK